MEKNRKKTFQNFLLVDRKKFACYSLSDSNIILVHKKREKRDDKKNQKILYHNVEIKFHIRTRMENCTLIKIAPILSRCKISVLFYFTWDLSGLN
jgi:hypothetical protein